MKITVNNALRMIGGCMTKEEFITEYCRRSDITREYFDKHGEAVPCDCVYINCNGWRYRTQLEISLNNND